MLRKDAHTSTGEIADKAFIRFANPVQWPFVRYASPANIFEFTFEIRNQSFEISGIESQHGTVSIVIVIFHQFSDSPQDPPKWEKMASGHIHSACFLKLLDQFGNIPKDHRIEVKKQSWEVGIKQTRLKNRKFQPTSFFERLIPISPIRKAFGLDEFCQAFFIIGHTDTFDIARAKSADFVERIIDMGSRIPLAPFYDNNLNHDPSFACRAGFSMKLTIPLAPNCSYAAFSI